MKINRVGGVGETYTDPRNGKMYKCTYAYKDSNGNFDCTWKEVGALPTNKIEDLKMESEIESEKISEGKISEKQTESGNVIEEKPVKEFANNNPRHNKTKYTNYSKR